MIISYYASIQAMTCCESSTPIDTSHPDTTPVTMLRSVQVKKEKKTLVSNTVHHQGNHKEHKLIYSGPISNLQPYNTIIQPQAHINNYN